MTQVFSDFSSQLQIEIFIFFIRDKSQSICQKWRIFRTLVYCCSFIYFIKHCNIQHLCTNIYIFNALSFQKVLSILLSGNLIVRSRVIRIFSTCLQIMPAESRKDNGHQLQVILFTPIQISFDINFRINSSPIQITITANCPGTYNISFIYNIVKKLQLIPFNSIPSSLSPVLWNSKHNSVISKLALLQKCYQLIALFKSIFAIIIKTQTPNSNNWFSIMFGICLIMSEVILSIQKLPIFYYN